MITLPQPLTDAVSPGVALTALVVIALLALAVAAGLVIALVRALRTLAKQSARLENAHLEVVRLRRVLHTQPPRQPMPRPGPPAEPTHAFRAPDATQQIPQVGPRIDRSAT